MGKTLRELLENIAIAPKEESDLNVARGTKIKDRNRIIGNIDNAEAVGSYFLTEESVAFTFLFKNGLSKAYVLRPKYGPLPYWILDSIPIKKYLKIYKSKLYIEKEEATNGLRPSTPREKWVLIDECAYRLSPSESSYIRKIFIFRMRSGKLRAEGKFQNQIKTARFLREYATGINEQRRIMITKLKDEVLKELKVQALIEETGGE
jgi:hypothetical protein